MVGGMGGGGLRLGLDAVIDPLDVGFPLDIVAINLVGAFLLAMMTGWAATRGYRPWMPAVGTGAIGAFTTFSALTVLPWLASTAVVVTVVFVTAVIVASIGAAAVGWRVGDNVARHRAGQSP